MVENLPANAGNMGSSPGLGKSHMPRSNWAREPQLLSLRVWSLCSTTREAAIVRGPRTAMKRGPRSPQLEKALAQKRRPNTAKNKQTNKQTCQWLRILHRMQYKVLMMAHESYVICPLLPIRPFLLLCPLASPLLHPY